MSDCRYCNRPAGVGSDFHVECKAAAEAARARVADPEAERFLHWLEPVIWRAVFRGVLLASFVIALIGMVLVLLNYAASH